MSSARVSKEWAKDASKIRGETPGAKNSKPNTVVGSLPPIGESPSSATSSVGPVSVGAVTHDEVFGGSETDVKPRKVMSLVKENLKQQFDSAHAQQQARHDALASRATDLIEAEFPELQQRLADHMSQCDARYNSLQAEAAATTDRLSSSVQQLSAQQQKFAATQESQMNVLDQKIQKSIQVTGAEVAKQVADSRSEHEARTRVVLVLSCTSGGQDLTVEGRAHVAVSARRHVRAGRPNVRAEVEDLAAPKTAARLHVEAAANDERIADERAAEVIL